MRIGVLGSGGMAEALGGRWVAAGHEVLVGGRSPERSRAVAARVGAVAGSPADAVAFGDAVLLAVPAAVAAEVLGPAPGRVVVDCTNSVVPGRFALDEPRAAVRLAERTGAHVVKAFNLCHVGVWRLPSLVFEGRPLGVPLCGDSAAALGVVRELVRSIGCVPVDGGPLERAELLEATTAFAIGLWVGGADVRSIFPPLPEASGLM
ncbi:NADPH-dependent F420 reductase [Saccharothrix syringae]|uniref:NADP oxidoreductase n=1 Tax=Saccharothrix syringae TaxID=103733 RepID=A0A5Q0H0M4_SACSY|nr:NAD(P)-binding domain-containing protein [Saccharothrix syringae]QFZ19414.1 NADP oxidoreductase [Saccharothrix syringae]